MKKMKWKIILSAAAVLMAVIGTGAVVKIQSVKADEQAKQEPAYVERYAEEGAASGEDVTVEQLEYVPSALLVK